MLYKVTGLKHYDFVKDGEKVIGNKLSVIDLREGLNGMEFGYQTDNFTINDDLRQKLYGLVGGDKAKLINAVVDIDFNRYGKVDCISLSK